jgi:hypothetical protein
MAEREAQLPTRIELEAQKLFAATEDQREAAKLLLATGAYREAKKDELTGELHPYFVAEKHKYKLADSPAGRSVLEFVAQLPEEPKQEQSIDTAFDRIVDKAYEAPPAAPVDISAPIPATLEAKMKAKEALKSEPAPQPVKLWKPEIPATAQPTPWIDDSNNQPIY